MKPKLINSPFRKQAFGAFLVTTIAVCLSEVSQAQTDNLWTGSVSSSWDTDENWNQGVVPTKLGNFHATINTDSPFIATISESIQAPVDIIIGTGVGSNGRVDHTGGEASTGDGNWMFVGRNGGMGIYNLADTAGSGGSFTGYGIGSGKMIVNGALYIGGTDGAAGSNGIVNINTNSDVSLAVNGRFQVGTNSSQGTLNLDNGSITTTEWTEFGNGVGCTGTLNMSGGSIAKNGNDHMGIGANGGTGVANITGGTISINNELWVGQGGGSNGTINLSNGTINIGSWVNIGRAGGTGTLNLSGGVINAGPNGDAFTVGDQDNSTGNLVQTGGELNISNQFWVGSGGGTNNGQYTMSGGNLNVNEWIAIGRGGLGEFNMSGGTFTKTGDGTALIVGSAGTGTFNQTGGLVNVVAGETWMGENGSGYYTLDGASAEFRTQYFQVARNESSNFTVNLNDGILLVNQIAGGTGNATVNFNGAQVVARSSQTAFIDGLDTAEIGTGSLKIDTNGFDLASNQPFMGSGGIIKSGEGVASFLGAHTYDGSNLIMAGQLILPNHATGTGDIQVDADASLGIREVVFNSQISPSNLTFAADSTLDFSFTDSGGLIQTNAPINVTGNLALGGNLIVNVSDVEFEIGSQPLIAYSSKSGDGVPVLGSLPENVSGTLEDSGSLVSFNITATSALAWDGDTDLWDLEATNWYDEQTSADDAAFTNDRWVNFDDLLTGTSDVVLNSLVSPAGTLFENNFFDFTLTGTGSIGGAGRLIKRGGALTSIDTANTYTGLTQIENGILSISAIADGGEASPIGQSSSAPENLVLAGGTLYYTGESASVDRSFITTATSGGIGTDNSLTITGSAKSTGGNFVKSGLGNLTLANNGINDFGGGAIDGVNVLAGTLTFDGSGGSQNNNVIGDIWVGTTSTSGANLVLADTAMSSADYLAIARGNGTTGLTSTVTLTNSTLTTGNLSLCYDNEVPGYNAAAVLTLNDSFYSVTGFNKIGESNGGNGTLVLDGSSTMSAGPTNIGQGSGAIGTLNIKGDSLYTTDGFNRIHVGSDAGSTGNLIIEGSGTMEVNSYVSVGFNGGGSMTVKENGSFSNNDDFSINESGDVPANVSLQDNGSITVAKVVYVGRNPDRVGTLTQTGGVFNGNGYEFQIGVFGTGSWLQSGGVTNASGWTSVGRHGGSTGVVTVSGGAFNQTGADRGLMIGEGGTGTLNIQESGTVNSMGSVGVLVGNSASGVGTINLDGGTLAAMNVRDGGGSSSFHFNGGVLMANTGANLNFMFSLDTADVKAGGAFIDSNDQTIAINQDLLDGTGGGGLTKVGAGFLQLNGNNTYTGVTTVSAGSLGGTGTIVGPLNVADTGTLAPGASVGSFTSGHATLAGTYAVEIDGTSSDQLIVNGDLDLDGANIEVMATAPIGSEWTIATYTGNLSGTVASVSEGYSIITSSPGLVKLVVTSDTPFSTWAATNISAMDSDADATADGDPDSDGLSNIVEFALNSNPLSGLSSGNIRGRVVSVNGSSTLVLTLPIRSGASFSGATAQVSDLIDGVIYSVEGSDQLITWDLVVSEVLGTDKTAIEADMPILENGWEYRTFQHPGVVATDPNGFLRAKITQP